MGMMRKKFVLCSLDRFFLQGWPKGQQYSWSHFWGNFRAQSGSSSQGQTGTLTRAKPSIKEPSMYKVVLLNDDFTPMDFVILILQKFFSKSEMEANNIMLQVHHQGSGIAGIFSHEIAETKVYLVNEYSRQHSHPLKCVMEKSQ